MQTMWSTWLLVALVLSVSGVTLSARMLALLMTPGKSHHILQFSVMRALAARGHQVDIYSYFPPPAEVENITHRLMLSNVLEQSDFLNTFEDFKTFCGVQSYYGFGFKAISEVLVDISEESFQTEQFQNLLKSNETYDLVFTEAMVPMESIALFGHKFQAPIVNFQGIGNWITVDWMAGNTLSVAHFPDRLSFGFSNKMSFMERFRNAVSTALTLIYYHTVHLPRHQGMIEKYYKDPTTPHITELLGNIALTLTNDIRSMQYPRPYTPNIIPIGTAHMSAHMTPIPEDVRKFLDNATEGVIFFSLGTLVPSHVFPKEYIAAFMNTFRKLSVKVLWKMDVEILSDVPENVKFVKWVPQPSVLAHPNCRLFITHGGLMSQNEVLYAGVPVVAMPFFADQTFNVGFYEYLGVGMKLDFWTITEDSVYKAITSVLYDKRYKENAEKTSRIVRDQPMSPMDSAVFWVEYVLRHRHSRHLKPASAEMSWHQLWLLDVAAAALVFLSLTLFVIYKVIRWTLNIFSSVVSLQVSSEKKRK